MYSLYEVQPQHEAFILPWIRNLPLYIKLYSFQIKGLGRVQVSRPSPSDRNETPLRLFDTETVMTLFYLSHIEFLAVA
jgi:hypothetical protein